ncbi:MAG: hypothetical protein R6U19_04050 [Bacteroidales bacterium]
MVKRCFFLVLMIIVFQGNNLKAQNMYRDFFKVSYHERVWAVTHPFLAVKSYHITKQTLNLVDSLQKKTFADSMNCDGLKDAVRHTLWMALLSSEIRPKAACRLGCAHELANYKSHKTVFSSKDNCYHDSVATAMDIHNNKLGLRIGIYLRDSSDHSIITAVLDSLAAGRGVVILKNEEGRFLDNQHQIIPKDSLRGRWSTRRVLIPTTMKQWPQGHLERPSDYFR